MNISTAHSAIARLRGRIRSHTARSLLLSQGIQVGSGFHTQAFPNLKIRGQASGIRLGDDVHFLGRVDLRNRENGRIHLANHARIDEGCRFVAANDARLYVGNRSQLGIGCILNAGADLTIGDDVLIGGYCYLQVSDHRFDRPDVPIAAQGYIHEPIAIGDGVWIGAHSVILKGVSLGDGCVVGAGSVVTHSFGANTIIAGTPAKELGMRGSVQATESRM